LLLGDFDRGWEKCEWRSKRNFAQPLWVGSNDAEILENNRNITHLGREIETFSDTAAIICSMDLVISTDTSVVHLAGSLGKPIWILLQFVPDWRWLLDRDDNPWYPTARLFRQGETRTWDDVIKRVHEALQDFCGASV
jgi:hypothetical protein